LVLVGFYFGGGFWWGFFFFRFVFFVFVGEGCLCRGVAGFFCFVVGGFFCFFLLNWVVLCEFWCLRGAHCVCGGFFFGGFFFFGSFFGVCFFHRVRYALYFLPERPVLIAEVPLGNKAHSLFCGESFWAAAAFLRFALVSLIRRLPLPCG